MGQPGRAVEVATGLAGEFQLGVHHSVPAKSDELSGENPCSAVAVDRRGPRAFGQGLQSQKSFDRNR